MTEFYWLLIKTAWERTFNFVTSHGITVGIVAPILGLLVFTLAVFVHQLLDIPAEQRTRDQKTNDGLNEKIKEQQAQISALKEDRDAKQQRGLDLTRLLPPPQIKPQQKEFLVEELKKVGPRQVLVKYLREPTSRASVFARELQKVFESASWNVRLISAEKNEVINKGFAIRRESGEGSTPSDVAAIMNAFSKSGVSPSMGTIIRGDDRLKEIEIEVGEM